MKLIFFVTCIASFLFLVTGCKPKHTESYYFSHPQELKSVLLMCQKKGEMPGNFDAECQLGYDTAVKITRMMQEFAQNQTAFGQRILRAQIRAGELAKQWTIAEKGHLPEAKKLKRQLDQANQHVDHLRHIVGMFIRM